jgi:ATP-binding cassette subfamily B protein
MLALVGESGSGKSTILKLLLHFYSPMSGDILIGNVNIKNIHPAKLREMIGYAAFDSAIYNDTILKNIVLDSEYDYDKLIEIIKLVNLDTEVNMMQQGFKTKIGENGKGLSAGQKQRLIIARALYKNPELLLLDEATGAIDAENEIQIMSKINERFKDKTRIIATHRLSSIKDADQIIVLKRGSIIEMGTHESLIEKRGFYFNMFTKQGGGYASE